MQSGGDGAKHGGSEQNRLRRHRQRDGEAHRIGGDLPDQRTAARTATDHHSLTGDAVRPHGVDHVGEPVSEPTDPGEEKTLQAVNIVVEA